MVAPKKDPSSKICHFANLENWLLQAKQVDNGQEEILIKIISGCGSRECQNQIEKENKRREENGIVSAIRNGKDK